MNEFSIALLGIGIMFVMAGCPWIGLAFVAVSYWVLEDGEVGL